MFDKTEMPTAERALPGRKEALIVSNHHFALKRPIKPPFPDTTSTVLFGMGCFWGAERRMWEQSDVYTTAAGYAAGFTPNPTYEEVCSGLTGHNEVVLVVYEDKPEVFDRLLKVFWEAHDPTQGMRQGNDVGTQYRSAIYFNSDKQQQTCKNTLNTYQAALTDSGLGTISTEVLKAPNFYYAENHHQQYLAKNPAGYCGLGGTGVCY